MKNYLAQSIVILFLTILSLVALSLVGEFTIGSFKIKKINIVSDIEPDKEEKLVIIEPIKPDSLLKDSLLINKEKFRSGIEDYSADKSALRSFFQGIRNTKNQAVRIAFFGDSFIEGDILCANFRDTLQRLYGGRGVGFVPITSEVSKFRTTIQHHFSNWKTLSIVGEKSPKTALGTSGYCFLPLEANEVEYKPALKGRTFSFHRVKLYLKNQINSRFEYLINDTLSLSQSFDANNVLQEFTLTHDNIQSIKFRFPPSDSIQVYGTSFEESTGVYVDNFAMRGNSGIGLYQIEPTEHKQFNAFRDYKLIILQYGLNVVHESDTAGYGWYVERMTTVINRLKESFPSASFLLLSVSDRSSNQNGTFETIPAIPVMVNAQRQLAKKSKIAFWDVYSAMGGKNSMVKFVNAKPAMGAKDYTHLNYWGGRKIAKLLADALLMEKKNYD